jgi:membrane-bound lytic murein transglycosylase A
VNRATAFLVTLTLAGLALCGCKKDQEVIDYNRPLPPGAYALRKLTDPAMIPDFGPAFAANPGDLVSSIDHSLAYLVGHPSSQKFFPVQDITHEQVVQSLKAFRQIVLTAASPEQFNETVRSSFDVYQSIGCDDSGTVLFTGYYQPVFEGSLQKSAVYKYPLYKLPADLVKDEDGLCLGRRLADGTVVPYPTRKELETGGQLAGLELVYLKDKFDAYICQVQGSALIFLTNGQWLEVGYAGKNAGKYESVGRLLLKDGKIAAKQYSLDTIRTYFAQHPEDVDTYCWKNDCFVFFQPSQGGPFGSLNVPVTPYRSIATDKLRDPTNGQYIFPRGALTFVETTVPVHEGDKLIGRDFRQFMLDQDTGGAIRAAGRADLFLGRGPEAGQIAGWTSATGKLYYLILKPEAAAAFQAAPAAPSAAPGTPVAPSAAPNVQ